MLKCLSLNIISRQRRQSNNMKNFTQMYSKHLFGHHHRRTSCRCANYLNANLFFCTCMVLRSNNIFKQIPLPIFFQSSLDLTHNSISKCSLLLCIICFIKFNHILGIIIIRLMLTITLFFTNIFVTIIYLLYVFIG